jgi:hypothetical protein
MFVFGLNLLLMFEVLLGITRPEFIPCLVLRTYSLSSDGQYQQNEESFLT